MLSAFKGPNTKNHIYICASRNAFRNLLFFNEFGSRFSHCMYDLLDGEYVQCALCKWCKLNLSTNSIFAHSFVLFFAGFLYFMWPLRHKWYEYHFTIVLRYNDVSNVKLYLLKVFQKATMAAHLSWTLAQKRPKLCAQCSTKEKNA